MNAEFSVLVFTAVVAVTYSASVYDLTHAYNNATVYWPTERRFRFILTNIEKVFDNSTNEYYEANRFCTAEHGGTHMDAPVHFSKDGRSISDIPVDELMGEAFIVDVANETLENADFLIETRHIQEAEDMYGIIPEHAMLLLHTGWSEKWLDLVSYLGTNTTNTTLLHFPGLHPEAAEWIVANRKVRGIGIDTASIDYGQSQSYRAHNVLMAAGIPVFENVKGIDQILRKRATVYALPMKIEGGSGAPVRIIAVQHSSQIGEGYSLKSRMTLLFITMVVIYDIC